MNYGNWIVVAFVLFAGIIISLVVVSMRQDVSLVAGDYYQQEVAYQSRINEMSNVTTDGKTVDVVRNMQESTLELVFAVTSGDVAGEVTLFRPSDADLDQLYALSLDSSGRFSIATGDLKRGLWKMKISWSEDGQPYFVEKTIVL